jgi:type II secretory pathway pseudopilin PulG
MKPGLISSPPSAHRGMVIMEVIIALLIFGMAAVGLMQAITASAQTAVAAQQELRMLLRLQSRLTEVSKDPDIARLYENPPADSDPDEYQVWTRVKIVKYEDEFTEIDNQPVNDMYHITVTAYYENFGQTGEISADTVRYAKLYATRAGANPQAPGPTPPQ